MTLGMTDNVRTVLTVPRQDGRLSNFDSDQFSDDHEMHLTMSYPEVIIKDAIRM